MTKQWQDWVELVLGVWLFISPWVLGYSDVGSAAGNAYLIGAAIAILSIAELSVPRRWEEWVNLVLGIWLIIAPWVLGFSTTRAAVQNSVVVGIIMIVLPLWAMGQQPVYHRTR